ncbi:MAG: hypothetical protein AAF355_15355 [Myxococcota bacterium]
MRPHRATRVLLLELLLVAAVMAAAVSLAAQVRRHADRVARYNQQRWDALFSEALGGAGAGVGAASASEEIVWLPREIVDGPVGPFDVWSAPRTVLRKAGVTDSGTAQVGHHEAASNSLRQHFWHPRSGSIFEDVPRRKQRIALELFPLPHTGRFQDQAVLSAMWRHFGRTRWSPDP